MKELREVLEAYEKVRRSSKGIALATIVKAKGSTYRRPGARMLMTLEGEMVGSVSGGCLEGDVFERAKKVIQSGESALVNYDTSSDDDLVWGLGLGCSGVVHLMVESLPKEGAAYLRFLSECVEQERPGVLATVFRVEGTVGAKAGSRLTVREDGTTLNLIEDRELSAAVLQDAKDALGSGMSMVKEYTLAKGSAEVFIEVLQPPLPLLILGAGHDAIPVVRLAKEVGWKVTVVDNRPAFASKKRFPDADRVILSNPEDVRKNVDIDERGAVVVMSHNFAHDRKYLQALHPFTVRYLGVLGPKKRTEMLIQDLRKAGVAVTDDQVARLYSPVGVDIGAETSEEIALSIIGEIRAVLSGRSGGLLRNRKGPIHDR